MKFHKIHLIALTLFSFVIQLEAEVFSLAPFLKKGGAGIEASKALGGVKLWSEPIVVNGLKTGMQITLMDRGMDEVIIFFKRKYPNAVFRASRDAVLIEILHKEGLLERLYLVNSKGAYPVIQFSMSFPKGLPKDIVWSQELPLPPSSIPKSTISLPERHVEYGTFTTLMPKKSAKSVISAKLISDGWQDLKQGVYIKKQPFSIFFVTFSENDSGETRGFVLKRKMGQ